MRDAPLADARGINGVQRWQEISKAGGLAPTSEEIQNIVCSKRTEPYTREELMQKITEFFSEITSTEVDPETGETVTVWKTAPTKARLALKLGISAQVLIDYVHGGHGTGHNLSYQGTTRKSLVKESDFDLLRNAYQLIESYYEGLLSLNRNNSGSIFWLLNSDRSKWMNEQRLDISAQQREIEIPERTAAEVAQKYTDARLLPPPGEETL